MAFYPILKKIFAVSFVLIPIRNKKWSVFVNFVLPVLVVLGLYIFDFLYFTKVGKVENVTIYANHKDARYEEVVRLALQKIKSNHVGVEKNVYVFFTDSPQQYKWFNYGQGQGTLALTRGFTSKIFISPSVLDSNIMARKIDGYSRSMADLLAHELTHVYLNQKIGFFRHTYFEQSWKVEGYCDYIANSSSFNPDKGCEVLKNDALEKQIIEADDLKARAYEYFKYRLYIIYLIQSKHLSIDQILDQKIDLEVIDNEVKLLSIEQIKSYFQPEVH